MMSGRLDEYLSRLRRELRKHGLADARIVEEAGAHLVDAVEDGLRRGLSTEAAEAEAFATFGAPEIVAAHVAIERTPTMNRGAALLEAVWLRKWWILAPTVLAAVVTSALSSYLLPPRYASEASIVVKSQRLSAGDGSKVTSGVGDRVQRISESALSRTRLERVIADFSLYKTEQTRASLDDVVWRMRRDINVTVRAHDPHGDEVGGFTVSFVAPDPRTAMKVTERLTSLFIEENFRYYEVRADEHHVGEQFKVVDRARLPERPVGPSRSTVNIMGGFAGLGLGLACVGLSSVRRTASAAKFASD